MQKKIIIGIDSGTSVVKAVAFDLDGNQLESASVNSTYTIQTDGGAVQSHEKTWNDCTQAIRDLAVKIPGLAKRTLTLSVTGQGEGTWLVGKGNKPVSDAWLWLDARSASIVNRLRLSPKERGRFEKTGTGLAACQQGPQIICMSETYPELIDNAEVALHCKDWLYLQMTGVRATDPSEASLSYGNFKTRHYDETVIDAIGFHDLRRLLPEIVDGTKTTNPLTTSAAKTTGLLEGTPVCLGFVDIVCTILGSGVYTRNKSVACSILGSTGMHCRALASDKVKLNDDCTGYVIPLPVPNIVAQVQSNMSVTINIDWILQLAGDLMAEVGTRLTHQQLVDKIEVWLSKSTVGEVLYHPYISKSGERGPFINADARAGFNGLNSSHSFPDLLRAVIDSLGMATRDCYNIMGEMPSELILTGGAARSKTLRSTIGASLNARTRISTREESGALGTAMIASVTLGVYDSMEKCIEDWASPYLSEYEQPDENLVQVYDELYQRYILTRKSLENLWNINKK